MITVLRLGHRPGRDKRITTHVALVARCFGADRMILTVKDEELMRRVQEVNDRFGGRFSIEFNDKWKQAISRFQGTRVHLTMYGERISETMNKIKRDGDLMVIVGAEKVPAEVYTLADFNIAVGNQPHSEVSALAIFLDRYTEGRWERQEFAGRVKIIPAPRGKRVERIG